MEELIKFLITPLLSKPQNITIEKVQDNSKITFNVFIEKNDIAKVIGKGGKMIKSIKNLVKIRAIKENVFVNVEVMEK